MMQVFLLARSITFARLGCLLLLAALLWGCESSPTKGGGAKAPLTSLSASERKSYDQALQSLADGKPRPAEQKLAQLSKSRANVAEVWLNLALSQYQQESYEQAQKTLQSIQAHFGDIAQAHNLAGLLAVKQGDFTQAEQHYAKAIKLKPAYDNALYNMALLQDVYLQNIASAVAFYDRYLALRPDDTDTKNWTEGLRMSLAR